MMHALDTANLTIIYEKTDAINEATAFQVAIEWNIQMLQE